MSNLQSLTVGVGVNLAATDSTTVIPNPPSGQSQPSGETPLQGLAWVVELLEATATPIQVEGSFSVELQYSLDSGSTYKTSDGVEIATADPALAASGQLRRTVAIGRKFFDELAVTVPTAVRWKTVYSTTGRVGGDGAATVKATSYLTRGMAE